MGYDNERGDSNDPDATGSDDDPGTGSPGHGVLRTAEQIELLHAGNVAATFEGCVEPDCDDA